MVKEISAKVGHGGDHVRPAGAKIRIGKFRDGKTTLEKASRSSSMPAPKWATASASASTTRSCRATSSRARCLLLDDGKIVLEVTDVRGDEVHTVVRHGGVLSNNKGINRQGGGLTAPALTAKDMEDIKTAVKLQADFLAVSFPKSGADMYMARELMRAAGGKAFLIAKIERAEAVAEAALIDIMRGSDGIMVARGDLAVEVGDASVPALQKKMIRLAREQNKLTITATQMMESMISSPVPARRGFRRGERGARRHRRGDAFGRDRERALPGGGYRGHGPHLRRGGADAAAQPRAGLPQPRVHARRPVDRDGGALHRVPPQGEMHRLAESGSTALWMSRLNCGVPIYALTSQTRTRYRCALPRRVPADGQVRRPRRDELLDEAEKALVANKVVKEGDLIVLTIGEPIGKAGGTTP